MSKAQRIPRSHLGNLLFLQDHFESGLLDERGAVDRPMPGQSDLAGYVSAHSDITKDEVEQGLAVLVGHVDDPGTVYLSETSLFVGKIVVVGVPFVGQFDVVWFRIVDEVAFGDTTVGTDVPLVGRRYLEGLQSSLDLVSGK